MGEEKMGGFQTFPDLCEEAEVEAVVKTATEIMDRYDEAFKELAK